MNTITKKSIIPMVFLIVFGHFSVAFSVSIDDRDSLDGVNAPKTLFDISVKDPQKLESYLTIIMGTYDSFVKQGKHPDMIIAFRGPTVRLINTDIWPFEEEDQESLKKSALIIKQLKKRGIKLEACSVATNNFHIENKKILPDIKVVGNTFVSLTGYQNKGYALIPIQ